jgi:RNA binding exosome subunit
MASINQKVSKKLLSKHSEIDYDGPTLLRQIIADTFITLQQASTFETKNSLFALDLKDYECNVVKIHKAFSDKIAGIHSVGKRRNDEDLMAKYLKSEYKTGKLTAAAQLMEQVEEEYDRLDKGKTWKPTKKRSEDSDVVALTAQLKTALSMAGKGKGKDKKSEDAKNKTKWKYEKSLGTNGKLTKNDKTYHWCDGPGHSGTAMWCIHKPGSCKDGDQNKSKSGTPTNDDNSNSKKNNGDVISALKATIANADPNSFGDDDGARIQAILAVINDL